MKALEANQIIARPAASMNAQVNATLAPPNLSGAWPKKSRVSHQGRRECAERQPDRAPRPLCGQQRTESNHRPEANSAKGSPDSGKPDLGQDPHQSGWRTLLRWNGGQPGDCQHCKKRQDHRHHGNSDETAISIKRDTERRPECKGGKHGHADPRDHTPGICAASQSKPPTHSARNDKAFRRAEERPSSKQNCG